MEELTGKLLEILTEMHPDVDFEGCDALIDKRCWIPLILSH